MRTSFRTAAIQHSHIACSSRVMMTSCSASCAAPRLWFSQGPAIRDEPGTGREQVRWKSRLCEVLRGRREGARRAAAGGRHPRPHPGHPRPSPARAVQPYGRPGWLRQARASQPGQDAREHPPAAAGGRLFLLTTPGRRALPIKPQDSEGGARWYVKYRLSATRSSAIVMGPEIQAWINTDYEAMHLMQLARFSTPQPAFTIFGFTAASIGDQAR